MNQAILFPKLLCENDVHAFLESKGFKTNHSKHDNEAGVDIVALKNGKSYMIEFKLLEQRDNGVYRYSGDIVGDILLCVTPSGIPLFIVNEKTSLTKTARLIDELFKEIK